MTLISAKHPCRDASAKSLEENVEHDYKAFPPVTDTIVWIKQVDWQEVGSVARVASTMLGWSLP